MACCAGRRALTLPELGAAAECGAALTAVSAEAFPSENHEPGISETSTVDSPAAGHECWSAFRVRTHPKAVPNFMTLEVGCFT